MFWPVFDCWTEQVYEEMLSPLLAGHGMMISYAMMGKVEYFDEVWHWN
jgi:hypothetical protein